MNHTRYNPRPGAQRLHHCRSDPRFLWGEDRVRLPVVPLREFPWGQSPSYFVTKVRSEAEGFDPDGVVSRLPDPVCTFSHGSD